MFCRSRSSKIRRQKRRPFSMQVGRWSKVSSIKVSKISSATRLELGSAVSTACLAPPAAEPQLFKVNQSEKSSLDNWQKSKRVQSERVLTPLAVIRSKSMFSEPS